MKKNSNPAASLYDGADLLESFLCCFIDAQSLPAADPRMAEARRTLERLDRHRKAPELAGRCGGADLEACLLICSPSAPAQFNDDTSLHLWNTLKEALLEIEPMAVRRGGKSIPRTLDQIWALLEASEISEGSGAEQGSCGQNTGTGDARRL